MNYPHNQNGFSLIECVIAIAILATVVGSMISMQGSVLKIIQFSNDKSKATIELRSVMAQFEYLLNTKKGLEALPKPDEPKTWISKSNNKFTDTVSTTDSEVKLSQFLISALGIYYMDSEDNEFAALKPTFQSFGNMLDSQLSLKNQHMSINATARVSWPFGKQTKNVSEKIYLMNNNAINDLKLKF